MKQVAYIVISLLIMKGDKWVIIHRQPCDATLDEQVQRDIKEKALASFLSINHSWLRERELDVRYKLRIDN